MRRSKTNQEIAMGQRQQQQQGPDGASGAVNAICQCQPEWVQNQTSLWLGRWANSSDFAHQIRTQVLMLAAASAARTPQAKQNQQQARQGSPNSANAMRSGSGWTRHQATLGKRGGSGNTAGHHHGAAVGKGVGRAGRHHQTAANNVAQVNGDGGGSRRDDSPRSKPIQGERGPKGDQGPRGERGPSGLISVKDRSALFDLDLMKADPRQSEGGNGQAVNKSEHQSGDTQRATRLVFVESEQMLVLETSSGWRPVPLLTPLHDFRKAIAKFSLNAASEAGKQLVQPEEANAINVPFHRVSLIRSNSRPGGSRDSPLTSNHIAGAINEARDISKLRHNGLNISEGSDSEDDNDDDDDDDDERDEDADEDDDDDEEEDEDDEDDSDEDAEGPLTSTKPRKGGLDDDDDDDDEFEDNTIGHGNQKSTRMGSDSPRVFRDNKITSETRAFKPKRRRAQVSSVRSNQETHGRAASVQAASVQAASVQAASVQAASSGQSMEINRVRDYNEPLGSPGSRSTHLKQLRLIALNEPVSGRQRGLRGANFECKRNAAQAGIKGAFQALLATSYQNLNEIVRHNSHIQKYPIVNMRGEILAASWQDLFRAPARTANPLSRIYSFDGRHVASNPNWPNKLIWLGTGNKIGARDSSGHNCDGWHSDSLSRFGFATPIHTPKTQHGATGNHLHHQMQTTTRKIRSHMRRFTSVADAVGSGHKVEDSSQVRGQNGTAQSTSGSNLVFDFLDKYPCRMPLIVLCIETIAQEL